VPSIVFGLFGLGFFVLTVGSGIDNMAYGGDKVFGTPCVLWASLTMALLTLPVMIVSAEEALRTVPRELREGALALGATKFSTITTVVIPTAMPGILTGVILAVARGAGEVAPLLLTGVVAHKDQLPFNPLEKFMNLAYHIYDLSVKSQPNKIEEAQALAFSAALVLVLVVLVMNIFAILLRARLSRIKVN
jgi:phosphate transport system permease protein